MFLYSFICFERNMNKYVKNYVLRIVWCVKKYALYQDTMIHIKKTFKIYRNNKTVLVQCVSNSCPF